MNFIKRNRRLLLISSSLCVLSLVLFSYRSAIWEPTQKQVQQEVDSTKREVSQPKQFGLTVDSFLIRQEKVQRNQFLSTLLAPYGVDPMKVSKLVDKSRSVFNVRSIAVGNPYTVFTYKHDPQKAAYFIYQPNPVEYVVFDLRDTLRVYRGEHEVTTKVETLAGKFDRPLYDILQQKGANPLLAMQLANIYGWAIDFYTITSDDWFKIQYERRYVEDKPVDEGRILSAIFFHKGKELSAFYFKPDGATKGEYYDEDGNSVRRAFLKAPLKFSRITSHYSKRRLHPVQGIWKAHLGTDYAAPTGTPIIATGSGVVIASAFTRFNGNYVKIRHNGTYTTQYLHMSRRAVRNGQQVQQGQVIGYVGSTGLATGPHVCYRFWKDGKQVDALKQRVQEVTPLPENLLAIFKQQIVDQQKLLADLDVSDEAVLAAAAENKEDEKVHTL